MIYVIYEAYGVKYDQLFLQDEQYNNLWKIKEATQMGKDIATLQITDVCETAHIHYIEHIGPNANLTPFTAQLVIK